MSLDDGRLSRRALLLGAAGAAAGGGLLAAAAACGSSQDGEQDHRGPARFVDFHGVHQAGIVAESASWSAAAAFTVVAEGRAALREVLREVSDEIEGLMSGRPPRVRDPAYPPEDSGLLGERPAPDDLSIVLSVGPSLFDERFGLAGRGPRELVRMTPMINDALDQRRCHGDLLLTVQARNADTVVFALRQLMRRTRSVLVLDWVVDGFNRGSRPGHRTTGSARNLLGFIDGTANLDVDDAALMDEVVWVGADDGEPAWAVGGSYHVVRVIRMFVERWDRTPLSEQESLMGRRKADGAPMGGEHETDEPDFAADPRGEVTALDAHIRLANPRTDATRRNLILRRGFSYTRGWDAGGQLDQGLAFVCYQRSFLDGFMAVQNRLAGERLEEYIRAEGGGFFFALPGSRDGDTFLGDGLTAA